VGGSADPPLPRTLYFGVMAFAEVVTNSHLKGPQQPMFKLPRQRL